jgi:hypothetical protein
MDGEIQKVETHKFNGPPHPSMKHQTFKDNTSPNVPASLAQHHTMTFALAPLTIVGPTCFMLKFHFKLLGSQ